jgi:sec-independent protein translocase protein TatC
VQTQYTISKYVSFVMLMILAFGVGFEFPVLLVFLQLVGIVTPRQLIKQWRISIMAIFVIAAVVTPSGDPISMLMLALPMVLLYLLSIVVGWLVVRRRAPVGAATA